LFEMLVPVRLDPGWFRLPAWSALNPASPATTSRAIERIAGSEELRLLVTCAACDCVSSGALTTEAPLGADEDPALRMTTTDTTIAATPAARVLANRPPTRVREYCGYRGVATSPWMYSGCRKEVMN
jgi:hypothetical protein